MKLSDTVSASHGLLGIVLINHHKMIMTEEKQFFNIHTKLYLLFNDTFEVVIIQFQGIK